MYVCILKCAKHSENSTVEVDGTCQVSAIYIACQACVTTSMTNGFLAVQETQGVCNTLNLTLLED